MKITDISTDEEWMGENNMTRIVRYYENEKSLDGQSTRVLKGKVLFHQFGVDFEEFETNAGNFSTAIIELHDGTVKNIPVEDIEFV